MLVENIYNQWHTYMSSKKINKIQLPLTLPNNNTISSSTNNSHLESIHFVFNNQFQSFISDPTKQLLNVLEANIGIQCYSYWTPVLYAQNNSLEEKYICGLELLNSMDDHYKKIILLVEMAIEFLKTINKCSDDYVVDIGNVNLLNTFLQEIDLSETSQQQILLAVDHKNLRKIQSIKEIDDNYQVWENFLKLNGNLDEIIRTFKPNLYKNRAVMEQSISECKLIKNHLTKKNSIEIKFDFTFTNRCSYYDDYIFKIYDKKTGRIICQGGCYDQFAQNYHLQTGSGMSFNIENLI